MVKIMIGDMALETVRPPEVGSIWKVDAVLPLPAGGRGIVDWISTAVRLPKNLEKVLFVWVMENAMVNVSMGYCKDGDWDIYCPIESFRLRRDICPVTHWMPLPRLPDGLLDKSKAPFVSLQLNQSAERDAKALGEDYYNANKHILDKMAGK